VKHRFFSTKTAISDHSSPLWIYWILFAGAIADASVWPFPVATLFVAVVLLFPEKSLKIILLSTLGTLVGAIAGYFTGRFAWIGPEGDYTRLAIFTFEHVPGFSENAYERAGDLFSRWHIWILFLGSFTPIPYGLFAVISGVFERPFLLFVTATIVSHLVKYSLLSFLAVKSGQRFLKYLQSRKEAIITIVLAISVLIILTALVCK
jgi:membrane protein YqaA with SNARE-associated domain